LAESSHSNSPNLTYISVRYWEKQTSKGGGTKIPRTWPDWNVCCHRNANIEL